MMGRRIDTPSLEADEIRVWIVRFVDDDFATTRHLEVLDSHERERAARFVHPHHRDRFIQYHAVARRILGRYLGLAATDVTFTHGRDGKPETMSRPGCPDIGFNLSHSGDCCMLAVRHRHPVGIDIEQLRPLPEMTGIAARWFSPGEAKLLAALTGDARERAFFALWTHKEAVVKALGSSLAANLDRVEFKLDARGCPQLASLDGNRPNARRFSVARVDAPDGYVAALASPYPFSRVSVHAWSENHQSWLKDTGNIGNTAKRSARAGERSVALSAGIVL